MTKRSCYPAVLHSVQEVANQLVVVDTGSRDDTVQIAQLFGAEVYHFDRIDDFAAAWPGALRQDW